MAQTNPYGANQYQMDPRQKLCWELYINPKSETFSNGYQSAVKAGYDNEYSLQITTIDWFLEKLRTLNMLDKAEKVLNKTLEMEAITDDGKPDTGVLRIQTDVAKFVADRLGREKYSTRTETDITSGGKPIVLPAQLIQKHNLDTDVPDTSTS